MKKATLKEIVDVMVKDVTPRIDFSDIKESFELVEFFAIMPYIIPSIYLANSESKKSPRVYRSKSQMRADDIGFVMGIVTIIGQAALYIKYPEYLPILAGTNAVSGIYEWGMNAKKRIEKVNQNDHAG